MDVTAQSSPRAFSMIELVIVVAITGIVAAIAVPKFADAGSGRRISAAKRTLIADVEMAQLRARATSKAHVIKFYPDENSYIIVEGTDIKRESVILTRDFDPDPYSIGINRTSLGTNQYAVISAFGDISPTFVVGLIHDNIETAVIFTGVADLGIFPDDIITIDEVKKLSEDVIIGAIK